MELDLASYDVIGFDMDYVFVEYDKEWLMGL
jgi:hypothetical protein